MKYQNGNTGFTLIELIIYMAIFSGVFTILIIFSSSLIQINATTAQEALREQEEDIIHSLQKYVP